MKTEKRVFIKVESQEQQVSERESEENARNSRKTLKVLQQAASDKENLAGRPQTFKDAKAASELDKSETKRKKLLMQHKAVQTGESIITAEDLTSDEPSVDYWRKLAETRGDSLNRSLQEVEKLKDDIDALKEENRICKEMLDESRHLVEVLQEMINEDDDATAEEEIEET